MKNLKTDVANGFESEGYNDIMLDVRFSNDPYDPWGSNIGWMFAIADYMYVEHGEILPGYEPGPALECGGGFTADQLEDLSYQSYTLQYGMSAVTADDIRRVYEVLSRRDDILKALGKSY